MNEGGLGVSSIKPNIDKSLYLQVSGQSNIFSCKTGRPFGRTYASKGTKLFIVTS